MIEGERNIVTTLSKTKSISVPMEWGNDELTKFIDQTNQNSLATFANMGQEFNKLIEIDKLYSTAKDCADHSPDYFPALFILKSHSAFLASVRLAIGTQTVESYNTMRGIIECALYGYYIFKHKDYARIWFDRDRDDECKKEVRQKFAIGNIFRELEADDPELAKIVKYFYDQTIDYGAHPNEKSLSTVLDIVNGEENMTLSLHFLTDNQTVTKSSLVTLARIGIISLKLSEKILSDRFRLIGLTDKINAAIEEDGGLK